MFLRAIINHAGKAPPLNCGNVNALIYGFQSCGLNTSPIPIREPIVKPLSETHTARNTLLDQALIWIELTRETQSRAAFHTLTFRTLRQPFLYRTVGDLIWF
jgi:hypothetical protein